MDQQILVFNQRERIFSLVVLFNEIIKAILIFLSVLKILKQFYGLNIPSVFYMGLCCEHKRDFVILVVKSFLQFHPKLFYFYIAWNVHMFQSFLHYYYEKKKMNSNLLWSWSYNFHRWFRETQRKTLLGLTFFQTTSHEAVAAMPLSGFGHISWWL